MNFYVLKLKDGVHNVKFWPTFRTLMTRVVCVKTHTYFGRNRLSCENFLRQNMYRELKHNSVNVDCTFYVIQENRANCVRF